jgi:hypothetical protein
MTSIIIIIIILRERQTRSPKAIEHTQVRLQPEPGVSGVAARRMYPKNDPKKFPDVPGDRTP